MTYFKVQSEEMKIWSAIEEAKKKYGITEPLFLCYGLRGPICLTAYEKGIHDRLIHKISSKQLQEGFTSTEWNKLISNWCKAVKKNTNHTVKDVKLF